MADRMTAQLDIRCLPAAERRGRRREAGVFNLTNNAIWSVNSLNNTVPGLIFLTDLNITSQTFGQISGPANASRSAQLRAEIRF